MSYICRSESTNIFGTNDVIMFCDMTSSINSEYLMMWGVDSPGMSLQSFHCSNSNGSKQKKGNKRGERAVANKRILVNERMETKYKLKQRCINFSVLICILFVASTDLTNRSIVKVKKYVKGSILEIDS